MIYLILLLKCFAKVAENEISDQLLDNLVHPHGVT